MLFGTDISPNRLRARLRAFAELLNQETDQRGKGYLRNGSDGYKTDEIERLTSLYAQGENNKPLSFTELCSFNTWFKLHPEKVAGIEKLTTSIHFPVTIKGKREDVERVLKVESKKAKGISKKSQIEIAEAEALAELEMLKLLNLDSIEGLNNLCEVNERFNTELQQLITKDLNRKHIFKLGLPSDKLQKAGIEYLPIEMPAATLLTKSSNDYKSQHPFSLEKVKNLPVALANPIAIFESEHEPLRKVILLDIKDSRGVNFICILDLYERRAYGKNAIVINSIISLYPKSSAVHIAKWFYGEKLDETGRNLLLWVDKEKALRWNFDHSSYVNAVKLSSKRISKIIQTFKNPK